MTTLRADPNDVGQQHRRLLWADVARGACVLLVVTHHLVGKHVDLTVSGSLGWVENVWLAATQALKPLRMPLFFTLSGFFAARAVARPWRDVFAARVAGPYYLYAVWLCIHAVIFSFATTLPMNRSRNLTELGIDLLYASTSMWYLYALPVYFVLLKLLHRSPALVLLVASVLTALALALPLEAVNRVSVLQNFVYFAAGATYPDLVRRIADSSRAHLSSVLLVAYAVTGGALLLLDAPRVLVILVVSTVAVPLALRSAVRLSTWGAGGAALAWVGRRTLPIYVLHVPLIALLHHLPNPLRWAASGSVQPVLAGALAVTYPVLASVVVAAGCLGLWGALNRSGLGWLFRRPTAAAPVAEPGRRPRRRASRG